MQINAVVNIITYYAALLPAITGLLVFRKLGPAYRLLWILAIVTVFQDILRWFYFDPPTDKLILNLYTIAEVLFIGLIYKKLIVSFNWKRAIVPVLIIFLIFVILNMAFIEGPFRLNNISLILESLLFIILAARLFLQLSSDVPSRSLLKHEVFWFNIGVFSYFSLNFFTFMLSDNLYSSTEFDIYGFHLWSIHDFINLFLNLSFAFSIWLASNRIK